MELLVEIDKHARYLLKSNGDINLRRKSNRAREELAEMIKNRLVQKVFQALIESGEFESAVQSIVRGEKDPYTAVDDLVLPRLHLS